MRWRTSFRSFSAVLRNLEKYVIVLLLNSMVVLFAFNVFIRSVIPDLSSSFAWIDELTRLLMVWTVFLTFGLALEKGRHVAVTTLLMRMSASARQWVARLINAAGAGFSLYLAVLSYGMCVFVKDTGQVSPTLGVPMYLLYVAPLCGFSLFALRYGMELIGRADRHAQPGNPS